MIELVDVSFSYGEKEEKALKSINLSVNAGECILLCGKSGCGKSTMLQLINGIIPCHYNGNLTGEIMVLDKEPKEEGIQELSKVVGSVFQNPKSQFFNLNTTDELLFACCNHLVPREEMLKRKDQISKQFRIEKLLDRHIFALSGGEKQKLACAGVAINYPKIYLLDEPSSNLDAKAIEELKRTLIEIKKQGGTILIAEHRLYYLLDICERFILMENGTIVNEYTRDEFVLLGDKRRREMGLRDVYDIELNISPVEFKKENSITINSLNCKYGSTKATLIDELYIPKNKIVALMGHNGAGKSTLVSALCGILKSSGEILDEKKLKKKVRIKRSFMVMQDVNHQLFTESVLDELMVTCNYDERMLGEAESLLDELSLLEYKELHPLSLSGGQKQRVAIATALFMKKKYLIFDEPTSGLDYEHMLRVARLIKQAKDRFDILIVITHDKELVKACCENVINIEKGKIVGKYTVERVT